MHGTTIKMIRKAKGFSQKEIYTGVVSKSFYSDFEAGKYSVEITKFQGLLNNLGISFEEFNYFSNQSKSQENILESEIDDLYKKGKFEKLYQLFEEYQKNPKVELRYLAVKAYLLVLITNTNFYKFSRKPFNEIVTQLGNAKMWTLKEIKLSKLVLLSLSETDKEEAGKLYIRIVDELEKYKELNSKLYYEEMGELHFNRIQSLLVIHDVKEAEKVFVIYQDIIRLSDSIVLLLQIKFIKYLVNLYLDFPSYEVKMKELMNQLQSIPTSETNFYRIIFSMHKDKAENYYKRYVEGKLS